MNEQINAKINQQINMEFFSSYLYLDISNFYLDKNLDGFANWFQIQTKEEYSHAFMFMQYLQDNRCDVILKEISAPNRKYSTFKEALDLSYSHEKAVTTKIHEIYEISLEYKDFRTMQFLDWFIKEQAEEEKNIKILCDKFSLFGQDEKSLYMLDNELKLRVYTPPDIIISNKAI